MTERMPLLFIGHGSPMNAIEDNEFSRTWIETGQRLPKPEAVLCISAHWETQGIQVTGMEVPRTIDDFYGFPPELYARKYPAPGSPALAERVCTLLGPTVTLDQQWGLDHGAWSVLCRLFPQADVPVVQLSLSVRLQPQELYDLGGQLAALRAEGVLILGSGNIVHNLAILQWGNQAYDWAVEYDGKVKQWIESGNHQSIIHYEKQGRPAALAVNSAEHYKPLLVVLGAQVAGEKLTFFTDTVTLGSISMRSLQVG